MGFVFDTIKKSAMIIKRTITKDSDYGEVNYMEPESGFEDMLDFIESDNNIISVDDCEINNEELKDGHVQKTPKCTS